MERGAGSWWPGQLGPDCLESERVPCPCLCWSLFPSLIFPTPSECIQQTCDHENGWGLTHPPACGAELTDGFRREG